MMGSAYEDMDEDCDSQIVTFHAEDLTTGAFFWGEDVSDPTPAGETDQYTIPLYDEDNADILGKFTVVKMFLPQGDCQGSEIWSFDPVGDESSRVEDRVLRFSELHCIAVSVAKVYWLAQCDQSAQYQ